MADNLTTQSATPATIPASTVIATDDAGAGGHVQIVKLARSTDGSATPITADADGMLVNLGTNNDVTVTGTVAVTQSGTWDEVGINDSGNSITVDNGGTFVVQENGAALTALQLIDDAVYTDGTGTPSKAIGVAGTDGTNPQIIKTDASGELQVDVLTMPAVAVTQSGTWDEVGINDSGNSITVDAPTGTPVNVQIGDGTRQATVRDTGTSDSLNVAIVDGSGNQITSFGGGTQYTEADTDASITGTAVMWEDTSDTLRVASAAKPLPVNVVAGGAAGGTSANDDSAFTIGSQAGTPIMGLFDDTGTDSVDENDVGVVRMSANRNLFTTLRDAAGNERGVNVTAGNALTVDGSAVTQPVSHAALTELAAAIDTELQVDVVGALPAGTNNIGDVDVLSVIPGTGATNLGKAIDTATGATDTGVLSLATRDDALSALTPAEGDNVQLRTDANGALWTHDDALDAAISGSELQVDIVGALPSGTNAIGKLSANSGVDIGDVDITSIAAGDNNIGNVDIVSLPALAAGTNAVGKLLPPDIDVTTHTNYAKKYYTSAGAVTDGIVWSPASGKRWHVVSMVVNVSAACTVTFEDDKAGGDEVVMKLELAANSGFTNNWSEMYPLASGEDAADLLVTTSGGNIYITLTGYEV